MIRTNINTQLSQSLVEWFLRGLRRLLVACKHIVHYYILLFCISTSKDKKSCSCIMLINSFKKKRIPADTQKNKVRFAINLKTMASRGRVFCKKSNYVVCKKIIGITDTCYLIKVCKLFSNNEEIVCQSVSQISTSAEEIWHEPRSRRDFMFKCSQNTLERLSWSSGGRATHAKVSFNKILNPKMNLCMCVNNTLMPVLMRAVKSTLSFQLK